MASDKSWYEEEARTAIAQQGGFKRGTVSIIGSQIGVGKSNFILNFCTTLGENHMARARAVMSDEDYNKFYGHRSPASIGLELYNNDRLVLERLGTCKIDTKSLEALDKIRNFSKVNLPDISLDSIPAVTSTTVSLPKSQTHECVCTHNLLHEGCKCGGT